MKIKILYRRVGLIFSIISMLVLELQSQNFSINSESYKSIHVDNVEELNTEYFEFSPSFIPGGIMFIASEEKTGKYDANLNSSFFKIMVSASHPLDTSLSKAIDEINSKELHKGPVSITGDDSYFYYTIENRAVSKNEKSVLTIASLKKENDEWVENQLPVRLPQNYSHCHPSFDENHELFIFSSDMPGGYGGMDLWVAYHTTKGWTQVYNLGPEINSSANEVFPFIFNEHSIFFTSDKEGSLGGLDLYFSNIDTKQVQHLQAPLNSTGDDFGLILAKNGASGYFSSSRKGTKGKDDIYEFHLQSSLLNAILVGEKDTYK